MIDIIIMQSYSENSIGHLVTCENRGDIDNDDDKILRHREFANISTYFGFNSVLEFANAVLNDMSRTDRHNLLQIYYSDKSDESDHQTVVESEETDSWMPKEKRRHCNFVASGKSHRTSKKNDVIQRRNRHVTERFTKLDSSLNSSDTDIMSDNHITSTTSTETGGPPKLDDLFELDDDMPCSNNGPSSSSVDETSHQVNLSSNKNDSAISLLDNLFEL